MPANLTTFTSKILTRRWIVRNGIVIMRRERQAKVNLRFDWPTHNFHFLICVARSWKTAVWIWDPDMKKSCDTNLPGRWRGARRHQGDPGVYKQWTGLLD